MSVCKYAFSFEDPYQWYGVYAVTKRHRKSMLLSELCVVMVSVPADIVRPQRGRGGLLKFRFSPYTQIEFLRVAILKVKAIVLFLECVYCVCIMCALCVHVSECCVCALCVLFVCHVCM